jgi:hypothetical protein
MGGGGGRQRGVVLEEAEILADFEDGPTDLVTRAGEVDDGEAGSTMTAADSSGCWSGRNTKLFGSTSCVARPKDPE